MLKQLRVLPATGLIIIIALLIFQCSFPVPATAGDSFPLTLAFDGAVEKNGLPEPWRLRVNEGKAYVKVLHENKENILYLRCRDSSFSLERKVSVSPEEYPYVTWDWKATRLPLSGDVRRKTRNDQGLQMLFAFENSKIISYVWDSNAPEGTVTDESLGWPFNISIKVIVVNSGAGRIDQWVSNTRNVYRDYRSLFHEDPPRLKRLRIQANTQYTQDSSEGMIKDITFSRKDTDKVARNHNQPIFHTSVQTDAKKQRRVNYAEDFCARHQRTDPRPERPGEI